MDTSTASMLAVLISSAWKGVLVLLCATVASRLLARRSAASRHLVWAMAMIALIAIPLLGSVVPAWNATVPVSSKAIAFATGTHATSETHSDVSSSNGVATSNPATREASSTLPGAQTADHAADQPARDTTPESSTISAANQSLLPSRNTVLFFLWLLGASVVVIQILIGQLLAWQTTRRSASVTEPDILCLLDDASASVELRSPVQLRTSNAVTVPCTWGIVRPTILLPADSTSWSEEKLRLVLIHELGHIKRMDWLTQLAAHVACAVHWFNPLAWMARGRAISEQEAATDDLVLVAGGVARDYASSLLDIARTAIHSRTFVSVSNATIAMSRPSTLEGRLLAILDANRRRSPMYRTRVLGTAILVAAAILPLSAFSPQIVPKQAVPKQTEPMLRWSGEPASEPSTSAAIAVTAPELRGEPAAQSDPISTEVPDLTASEPSATPVPAPTLKHEPKRMATDTTKVRLLLDALNREPDAEVRAQLVQLLGNLESSLATQSLSRLLVTDESERVRSASAWALSQISDPASVDALEMALSKDASDQVRERALMALAEIGSSRSRAVLESALTGDKSESVRAHAAWALGELHQEASVPALQRALDDESEDVRSKAIWSLGEIGSPISVDVLKRLLSDDSADVRRHAAYAIGEMGDESLASILMTAVRDANSDVRRTAVFALGEIGSPTGIDALVVALSDEDPEVRSKAAWSLAEIGSTKAAAPLLKALSDSNAEVRRNVARALGEAHINEASEPLMNLLRNDPDKEVRKAAAMALSELDF